MDILSYRGRTKLLIAVLGFAFITASISIYGSPMEYISIPNRGIILFPVLWSVADWDEYISDGEWWEQKTSIATARLYLKHRVDEANSWLAQTTDRYGTDKNGKASNEKYPHPPGSASHDWDFINMYIVRAYFQFRDDPILSSSAKQNMEEVLKFRAGTPTPVSSENHKFMMVCAGYFGNLITGGDNIANKNWMLNFLDDKLEHHFYEMNSPHYMGAEIKCLLNLIDFSPDAILRGKARAVMDMLMTEIAVIHCAGARGGPFYRYYDVEITHQDHDYHYYAAHAHLGTPWKFDWTNRRGTKYFPRNFGWYTTYRVPQIVLDLAHANKPPFVLKSRRDIMSTIYYVTPSCVLASAQGSWSGGMLSDSYTGGRGHNWDITFATSPAKLIFSGSKIGDWAYDETNTVQKNNVLITSRNEPVQYKNVSPVTEDGWNFVHEGDTYVAIRTLANGRVLVEVRNAEYYGGTFSQFKAHVKSTPLDVNGDRVEYTNTFGETIISPTKYSIEGESFSNYNLYDSPYLSASWGSGVITVNFGGQEYIIQK